MMLEAALAGVVIPALMDVVKTGMNGISQYIIRKAGGVQPTTIAEKIELDKADVDRLRAIAELDNPHGTPSQWVVDLRASFRYISAGLALVGFFSALFLTGIYPGVAPILPIAGDLAAGAAAFIFGERLLLKFK
jgi:hypothetical protein